MSDTLVFFRNKEIPFLPSGDQHDRLLLDAHRQLISEGEGCRGGDGAHLFLEPGSEGGGADQPHSPRPRCGQKRGGLSLGPSALAPTAHPPALWLHPRPEVPRGSLQLCGTHPTCGNPPVRAKSFPGSRRTLLLSIHSCSVCF